MLLLSRGGAKAVAEQQQEEEEQEEQQHKGRGAMTVHVDPSALANESSQ